MHAWKLGRVFKKKMCSEAEIRWRSGKINRAVISDLLAVRSVLQVGNCSTRCHELEIIIVNGKPREQFKNCWTAPCKSFSEWIYKRLRTISRTTTQESSEEIYCRWNILTPLCSFQVTRCENLTAKTSSPEQHYAFRELQLKFVGASTDTKEDSSSQKLASSKPFGFLTSSWPEVSLMKYDN